MGRASHSRDFWAAVDRVVARAPTIADLRSHGLLLLAARHWRELGRDVPLDVVELERRAAVVALTAPRVLAQVRSALDGPAILHKGPEVAKHYPDPALRLFGDVDLLVPDAERAQRALLAAGFEPTGDPALYMDIHHLRPLRWGDMPVIVEIHSRPKWVDALPPPHVAELLDVAVPSTIADGFLALPAEEHALLLAVHSWAHEPMRRLRDLVDVGAVAGCAEDAAIATLARRWGVGRLWRSTHEVLECVFDSGPQPLSVRTWARNLVNVRDRTVLENHLERWLSSFWLLPPGPAVATLPRTLLSEIRPAAGETWSRKLGRSARAMRNASRRRSEHQDELARDPKDR